MHDKTGHSPPYRLRNATLHEGCNHYLGREEPHRLLGYLVVDVEFHRQVMAARRELHVETLRQAVERVGEQQNTHQQILGSCSPLSQSTIRSPPNEVRMTTK